MIGIKNLLRGKAWSWLALAVALFSLLQAPLARAEVFYGITANGIFSVDASAGGPATQLVTFSAALASAATLATRPSDGMLFYLDTQAANPNLWRWDPANPSLPPVLVGTPGATTTGVIRLGFDAAGNLYAMNSGVGTLLWRLDPSTGAIISVTPVSGALGGNIPGGGDLCLHPSTGVLYMVAVQSLYTITPSGVVTLLGVITGLPGSATGCAFARDGTLMTSPGATLHRVNIGTLAATAMPVATGVTAFGDLGTSPNRSADLRVSKSASNLTPGNTVSFSVTVTNDGPDRATDVRVLDLLPAGLTFVSATPSQGVYSATAVVGPPAYAAGTWRVGALNNGAAATLTLNASVTGTTPITNTAQVSYVDQFDPDSTPGSVVPPVVAQDDQASVTITPSPDLRVVKTATSSFAVGANATYSIAVNNTLGSLTTGANAYTVIDNMPTGLTLVSAAGTLWNCAASTATQMSCTSTAAIAAGASNANAITLTVLPDAAATPSVVNTATVSGGGEPASNSGNNSSAISTTVCTVSCPDLIVNKTLTAVPGPNLAVGTTTSTYTLSVSNIGGLSTGANNYVISDTLPAGLTLTTAAPAGAGWMVGAGWTCTVGAAGGSQVTCNSSTAILPAGTSSVVTFPITVGAAAAPSVTNTATVSGVGEPAAVTGNNSTSLTSAPVLAFDLTVTKTKTVAGNFVLNVDTATYTLTVNNIGGVASTGLYTVTDTLPAGLTLNAIPTAAGWTCTANVPLAGDNIVGGGRVVCSRNTVINAGAAAASTIVFPVRVRAGAAPSVTNTASISNPDESANLLGNNSSAVTTPVNAPDLIVTKSHNGNFTVGVNNSYTITVSNIGLLVTSTANVVVTDTLPAGLTFVSGTGTGWNACTAAGQVVTCVRPLANAIVANDSTDPITLTVAVGAAAAAASPVTNTVSVSGGNEPAGNVGLNPDPIVTDNDDTDSTNVYHAPTIAKSFAPTPITAGGVSALTLTISNPAGNTVSLTGVAVTDNFPAGMSVAATPAFSSSCGPVSAGNLQGDAQIVLSGGGPVAPGASCVIAVNVTSTTTGANVNTTGNVSSTNTVTGNTAAATLTVNAPGNPILTKLTSPNPVRVNQPSTLTFTITNKATATADMGFTDTLPTGVVISTPNGLGGTCTGGAPPFARTATAGASVITVVGVDLAGGATCTVIVNVQSAAPGSYLNDSTRISALAGGLTAATLSDTLIVERPTLTKAFSPSTIPINAISALTFTISNGSQAFAETGLAFTETFPAGVVLASPLVTSSTCSGTLTTTATTLALASGTLALGQTSCAITVNVTSSSAATYNNTTANVTGVSANLTNNAVATLIVTPPPVLSKNFSPAEVGVAQSSALTFTISNIAGNPAQSSLAFTDTLPANLVLADGITSNTCNGTLTDAANNPLAANATAIKLAGGSMTLGTATCTITVNVRSNLPAAYLNNASNISGLGGGLVATGLASTLTVRGATLTKLFSPAVTALNSPVDLTFTFANSGSNPAQAGLSFTDTLAGGLRVFAAPTASQCGGTVAGTVGGNTITFTGGSLASSVASCTITVSVYSVAVGVFTNNAGNISNLSAGVTNNVNATLTVNANAELSKAFSAPAVALGQSTTLVFTLNNLAGASAASGLSFTDTLPAGLVVANPPAAATTCSPAPTFTATDGASVFSASNISVAVGPSTCTITLGVRGTTAGTKINGAANITAISGLNNDVSNQQLDVYAPPTVTKTFTPNSIASGGTSSMVITVTNPAANPGNISGVSIDDVYTGTLLNNATGGVTCSGAGSATLSGGVNGGGSVGFNNGTIVPGGACIITQSVTASSTNINTTTAPTATGPVALTGTAANATLTVTATPDLALSKTHSGNFVVGATHAYTLTVNNSLGTAATIGTITVTDTLPTGLSYAGFSGTGWACSAVAQVVTCTSSGVINANAISANPLTLNVLVGATAQPAVTNNAAVSGGGEPGANTGNNSALDYTVVAAAPVNSFLSDGMQTALPASAVFYAHQFIAGSDGSVLFSTANVPSPAIAGWTHIIYRDSNCNGVLDGAEGATPLLSAVSMSAGEQICIVVKEFVPAAAPLGAQDQITVTAAFTPTMGTAQSLTRTDLTTVGNPGLTLAKAVRVLPAGAFGINNSALPGQVLEYQITYTNTGSGALSNLVINDATPSFTTFVSASCGVPPPNISGCATTQPSVGGVGGIAWTLSGTLAPGSQSTVLFQVNVVP